MNVVNDPNAPSGTLYFLNQTALTSATNTGYTLGGFLQGGTISGGSAPIQTPVYYGGLGQAPVLPWPPGNPECAHEAWEVRGNNPAGYGTCLNCGGYYGIDVLINALRDRLLLAVARLEARLAEDG